MVVLQLIITHGGSYDAALLDSIAAALTKAGLQERCGDLYQHLGRSLEALQAYRKAHSYRQVWTGSRTTHSCATHVPPSPAFQQGLLSSVPFYHGYFHMD